MENLTKRRKTIKNIDTPSAFGSDLSADLAYQSSNSFYVIPPVEEISIEQFENFGIDRVKVLKEIENIRLTNDKQGVDAKITAVVNKYLPLKTKEDYRKDVISHFILRLAYCRPADRKWFITQEAALFRFRMKYQYKSTIASFCKENNLDFSQISKEEYKEHEKDLLDIENMYRNNFSSNSNAAVGGTGYFKVPFEEAIELVKNRRVKVLDGFAFVSIEDFSTILISRFKQHLSSSLISAFKSLGPVLNEYDTVTPILNNLATRYLASDYTVDSSKRSGQVQINQLDMLAKRSFPLCMRNLHNKLKETHHLRHMGRMQYGLFLKGIGLSMEDALLFWRNEFCQIMGVDKFDKAYAYNIRHNYGREGKRTDYTPYSCMKIIMGHVGPGEHHGCPFRHFDGENLKYTLSNSGVPASSASEILGLVKENHFQVACKKYFEVTHPGYQSNIDSTSATAISSAINHPNQYFDISEKYFNSSPQNGNSNPSNTSN